MLLSLSSDDNTLAFGAYLEKGSSAGINGTQNDSGAVYVFGHIGATWTQQAYVKAKNSSTNDR